MMSPQKRPSIERRSELCPCVKENAGGSFKVILSEIQTVETAVRKKGRSLAGERKTDFFTVSPEVAWAPLKTDGSGARPN